METERIIKIIQEEFELIREYTKSIYLNVFKNNIISRIEKDEHGKSF